MERKPKPKGPEEEGSCPQPHSRLLVRTLWSGPPAGPVLQGAKAVHILFLHCLLGVRRAPPVFSVNNLGIHS